MQSRITIAFSLNKFQYKSAHNYLLIIFKIFWKHELTPRLATAGVGRFGKLWYLGLWSQGFQITVSFCFMTSQRTIIRYSSKTTSAALLGLQCFIIDEVSGKKDWQNEFFQNRDGNFTYVKGKCPSFAVSSKEIWYVISMISFLQSFILLPEWIFLKYHFRMLF